MSEKNRRACDKSQKSASYRKILSVYFGKGYKSFTHTFGFHVLKKHLAIEGIGEHNKVD